MSVYTNKLVNVVDAILIACCVRVRSGFFNFAFLLSAVCLTCKLVCVVTTIKRNGNLHCLILF
jgi:hypothetical protein